MWNWLLLAIVCIHKVHGKSCIVASKQCEHQDNLRFTNKCPNIGRKEYWPQSTNCSEDCVKAITALKHTEIGASFDACDCEGDGYCLTWKARVTKCLEPDHEKISCTMAIINCTLNHTCKKLKHRFLRHCTRMISGIECEKKCQKAQRLLFTDILGKSMEDCECDGANEAYCRAIRAHAEQLRCKPGMDGSGTPNFDYKEETLDTDGTIHGTDYKEETLDTNGTIHGTDHKNNTSVASLNSAILCYAVGIATAPILLGFF